MNLIKTTPGEPAPLVDGDTPLDEIKVIGAWSNKTTVKKKKVFGVKIGRGRRSANDLDLSALLLNEAGQVVRACSVEHLDPMRGAIVHSGDDEGTAVESQEEITATLSRISQQVQGIAFTLTSFGGGGFDNLNGVGFELWAGSTMRVEILVPISLGGKNAAVLALLWRRLDDPNVWDLTEVPNPLYQVQPYYEGNRDGVVNWQDMTPQFGSLLRRVRTA